MADYETKDPGRAVPASGAAQTRQDPRDAAHGALMPRDAEVSDHELQTLDALEVVTRTEDPDALERYVDGLPLSTSREMWHRLRAAAREHQARSERLERMAGLLSQQLHAAGDGASVADTRPQPARPF